jgi:t-SNARE complex subunit (syntaxin)
MCSGPTPLAFSEDDDKVNGRHIRKKKTKTFNICDIILVIIVLFGLYMFFKK